jgi:hypothetical protein
VLFHEKYVYYMKLTRPVFLNRMKVVAIYPSHM